MKVKITRCVTLILLIAWMGVIFAFSAQTADKSSKTSSRVVEKVVSVVYPDYDKLDISKKQEVVKHFSIPIRKAAHFFEFSVLGALFCCFISTLDGYIKKHRLAFSLLFSALYAVSDELHQYFISGRACRITDIIIDTCGALFAVMICYVIYLIRRRKKVEQ